jgi:hypothetical protein
MKQLHEIEISNAGGAAIPPPTTTTGSGNVAYR